MNVRELLKDEFFEDELKKTIEFKEQLKNSLFANFLDDLIVEETYKTQDVSDMLGKSDANLRYYLRELDSYIEPLKIGRSYRLTYKSIFKLHMVVLLINNGYLLDDILVKLGMKLERVERRDQRQIEKKYDDDAIEQILFSFKQQLEQTEKVNKEMVEYMDHRFEFYEKMNELKSREYEIKLIDEKIERVEMKLSYHRMEKKRHKQNILMLQKDKNNGLLSSISSLLKKKDNLEIEKQYQGILKEAEEIEEDNVEISLNATIKDLKESKEVAEKECLKLKIETDTMKDKILNTGSVFLLDENKANKE